MPFWDVFLILFEKDVLGLLRTWLKVIYSQSSTLCESVYTCTFSLLRKHNCMRFITASNSQVAPDTMTNTHTVCDRGGYHFLSVELVYFVLESFFCMKRSLCQCSCYLKNNTIKIITLNCSCTNLNHLQFLDAFLLYIIYNFSILSQI